MKPLVVIPARGGSKGVSRKNIKLLAGKPLIQYTVEAARALFEDRTIIVSTDDPEIKTCVEQMGLLVPFLRPASLATDTASTNDVILHAVEFAEAKGYQADTLIFLQPTSPFRTSQHIREAVDLFDESCEMLVSVKETKANPYYVLFEENEEGFLQKSKSGNFTRRQDCPPVWELNGAIYIVNVEVMKAKALGKITQIKKYVMDDRSSHDIDTIFDWKIAEVLARE